MRREFATAVHLAEVTGKIKGKRLAVIIDGQIYATPIIRHKIRWGVLEFFGSFDKQKAIELAVKVDRGLQR